MGSNRYLVYGRSSCFYCNEACEALTENGKNFIFFDESELFLEYVKTFYDRKTVPIILSNDLVTGEVRMVGGSSDLKEFLKND